MKQYLGKFLVILLLVLYFGISRVLVGFSMYTTPLKLSFIIDGNNRNTTTLSPKKISQPNSYHLQKEPRNETSKHYFERGNQNSSI